MFAGVDDGRLVFSSDFTQSGILLYQGLLVPQAWTLGVEQVYAIAPQFLRYRSFRSSRKKLIFTLLVFSILVRVSLIAIPELVRVIPGPIDSSPRSCLYFYLEHCPISICFSDLAAISLFKRPRLDTQGCDLSSRPAFTVLFLDSSSGIVKTLILFVVFVSALCQELSYIRPHRSWTMTLASLATLFMLVICLSLLRLAH